MRFLPFYQVQFGWLDETSGFLPTFHVESNGLGRCRQVPLSRQVRPGSEKQLQRVLQQAASLVPAVPH